MKKIVCFGEVLWDIFPTHKKIGGAPLNVATRLKSLDNEVAIITRIGKDTEGDEIAAFIKNHKINAEGVQIDKHLKTGDVQVSLNAKGSASYTIMHPRAWDHIAIEEHAKLMIAKADAFVFGSLIARDAISRDSLFEYLKCAKYKILDINLRPPHYTIETLLELMYAADFIKFNDEEIFEIAKALGQPTDNLESIIQWIAKKTNTKCICVTLGKKGAILFKDQQFCYNKGYKIKVVDTVGAGDSFLATLIDQLLKDTEPQAALNKASAVGAIVASSEGANPVISEEQIVAILNN
ncbi:carbohydrate kinase [Polaribacter reichenbachii]|uniref:Carbohydrate kinase n=1 Tax=Polaribacter reichenbachii TaxID=996801 RepID=A0A1B8U4A3_9FLAO|nr:carbohydrate kinase [Polaribacter reichenbachii]APZ47450.1 carbohydrate kinase [Polaribacter reichenbachii]AUC18089.1 carbohydrate kinase [Polaribacter reichenbachii]OBY66700.1 carbohydrate kinase [Polaribacter reichenbachii]